LLRAFDVLFGQRHLALPLRHHRAGGGDVAAPLADRRDRRHMCRLCLGNLGFGHVQFRLECAHVHAGKGLPGAHIIAFAHRHAGQPPAGLAGDIDFGRFDATVARGKGVDQRWATGSASTRRRLRWPAARWRSVQARGVNGVLTFGRSGNKRGINTGGRRTASPPIVRVSGARVLTFGKPPRRFGLQPGSDSTNDRMMSSG
jgi:hypothetical protein